MSTAGVVTHGDNLAKLPWRGKWQRCAHGVGPEPAQSSRGQVCKTRARSSQARAVNIGCNGFYVTSAGVHGIYRVSQACTCYAAWEPEAGASRSGACGYMWGSTMWRTGARGEVVARDRMWYVQGPGASVKVSSNPSVHSLKKITQNSNPIF